MSKVYIVQDKPTGIVLAVFVHYEDARQSIKDGDRPERLDIVPKRVIKDYQEDLKENEGF